MNSLFDSHSILVVAPVKPEAQARVAQRLLGYTEGTEKWEMKPLAPDAERRIIST